MIAFDNGPARGDYVRYIDDLMARAALTAPTATASDADLASSAEAMRERTAVGPTAGGRPRAGPGDDRSVVTTPPVGGARPLPSSSNGFAAPAAPSRGTTAASTIASALMSGQVGRRSGAVPMALRLAALGIGALFVLIGLFWQGVNIALLISGGALVAWALRRRVVRGLDTPRRSA